MLFDALFQDEDPSVAANPAVLSAAAKFRRLTSVKKTEGTPPTRYLSQQQEGSISSVSQPCTNLTNFLKIVFKKH